MSSGNTGSPPNSVPEFLDSFDSGRVLWKSLRNFPEQDATDRQLGDSAVQEIGEFLEKRLDPEEVDRTRRLPEHFLEDLQERGFLRLRSEPGSGGLGLSAYNAFRVVERAAAWSAPAGQVLGIQAGVGAGAMLPAMPPGELRDVVQRRIAEGAVSGFGDTDEAGQNNTFPLMTATLSEDGSAWVLHGEKLFTGHGPVADLLGVSATVVRDGRRHVGAFFVDTRDCPGFRVVSRLEYLGSRGLPNAALAFDGVRVPGAHALIDDSGAGLPPMVGLMALVGRVFFTGAPALAIARNCLAWSLDFVRRRTVDGKELGAYDSVQRIVATSAAEVYAMDSAARWALSGPGAGDQLFERFVAKNVLTTTCWRVVDRTMSLLAAEGFETVSSKERRGAPALPLERAFRDARGLRIAGNIDFRLDEQAGRLLLDRHYAGRAAGPGQIPSGAGGAAALQDRGLSAANQEHLRLVDGRLAELAELCATLTRAQPDPPRLWEGQRTVLLIGRIATELFTMCAVLSRASSTGTGTGKNSRFSGAESQEYADIHCAAAELRVAAHLYELASAPDLDYAAVSARLLSDAASDRITGY
ncbi:acyl-CoA dehydrogenase family protein [Streptomyces sp. NPDC020898]|uniref:acyl-CoA dehydrogenase family protein n=1 Tax=Streptomyces sp. NPDC020898 TaxID=3365101 RepID=UPI0037B184B0